MKLIYFIASLFLVSHIQAKAQTQNILVGKTVNVIVPFTPGGGVDQTFRHFEKFASEKYDIKFVVNYRSGAEGSIGMIELTKMPKNGLNILFGTVGTVAMHRLKNSNEDVEIITGIKNSVMALIASKGSNIITFSDLLKSNSVNLNFGYGAPAQKMFLDQLIELSPIRLNPVMVPYKGTSQVLTDLMGNHIQIGVVPLHVARTQIASGTVTLIAISSKERISEYSSVPSIFSLFPEWKNNEGFVVVTTTGIPKNILEAWNEIFKDYLNDKSVKEDFTKEYSEIHKFGKQEAEKNITSTIKFLERP